MSASVRDEALFPLLKVLTRQQISNLLFDDLAVVDPKSKFVEARRHVPVRSPGRGTMVPPAHHRSPLPAMPLPSSSNSTRLRHRNWRTT